MEIVLYIIGAIVAMVMFLPASGTTQIRNLPLLIALLSLVALYFIYRFIRAVVLLLKTKSCLISKGYSISKVAVFPFGASAFGRLSITAHKDGETLGVLCTLRKRKHWQCCFCDAEHLEFYKWTMSVAKSSKRGTVAQGRADKRRVRKQRLVWRKSDAAQPTKNILVFDKFPYSIKTARGNTEVGNGDDIGGAYIYDFKGLKKYM